MIELTDSSLAVTCLLKFLCVWGLGYTGSSLFRCLRLQKLGNSITYSVRVILHVLVSYSLTSPYFQRKPNCRNDLKVAGKVTWLSCFSQKTADKDTTGCPGKAPPSTATHTQTYTHLSEQKQSHESLGIQRCRKGTKRFQFVFASTSTQGLCVLRLLISAHLGKSAFLPKRGNWQAPPNNSLLVWA